MIEPTSGCSVTNKSYFKIAVNGTFGNGSNAKPGNSNNEVDDKTIPLNIYPNPASSKIILEIPHNTENAVFRLMDNSGRKILENTGLKSGKNEIDIRRLAAGIYFYEVGINEQRHYGKLVKD